MKRKAMYKEEGTSQMGEIAVKKESWKSVNQDPWASELSDWSQPWPASA